ncbi:hypothetical protein [Dongia deserti]|uniref:hypothetical protein n=1 Tax=Dongia deserti TaxID=2268030 RepID=UPI0013C5089D|nr:hypothetical protein [Dongia deserti]
MLALLLNCDDFNDSSVCLGPQVASVLEALVTLPELSNVTWYAASVDAMGSPEIREAFRNYESHEARPVRDGASFVSLVRCAVQFLDGVFFCVPVGQEPVVAADFLTTDGPIERLVTNSIVEVCTADTSIIWIGTDVSAIIDIAQRRFGGRTLQSRPHE